MIHCTYLKPLKIKLKNSLYLFIPSTYIESSNNGNCKREGNTISLIRFFSQIEWVV